MTAIERIQGFACEVDQEKWEELVRVAKSVDAPICNYLRLENTKGGLPFRYIGAYGNNLIVGWGRNPTGQVTVIPYPDFLAKLKGDEKWEPKNGEEVEVKGLNFDWKKAKFIGMDEDYYVCEGKYDGQSYIGFKECKIRPLRPTITRTEAEQKLKELGHAYRIID